mmetsp:Transcript_108197/g.191577  ORF Transcript_108197/g.191577 Transcript_108197/m.191577 type:complete len:392 (-) Transcript_108197:242-1417(-)
MRNVLILAACFACRSHTSTVRSTVRVVRKLPEGRGAGRDSQAFAGDDLECLNAFAVLLLALKPAVAFYLPGVGAHLSWGTSSRTGHAFCSSSEEGSMVRLDKLLADRGAGTRKEVDKYIRAGLVDIDGEVVPKTGGKMKVPWECCPFVDGIDYPPPPILAAYCKPLGVVSTMLDERGRPDLSAVMPDNWRKFLKPVGRLDADTSGLLLFSRSGDLTQRLLHPKYGVEREYVAEVENPVDAPKLGELLAKGVQTIEDGEPFVVQAKLVEVVENKVRLIVTEGKHRMVRRILANAGHPVIELRRIRFGEIRLEELEIEEDDVVEIDGEALDWALGLLTQAAPKAPLRQRIEKRPSSDEDDWSLPSLNVAPRRQKLEKRPRSDEDDMDFEGDAE